MAASPSSWTTIRPCKMLAFSLLLITALFNAGVVAQEDEVVAATVPPLEGYPPRGDFPVSMTDAPVTDRGQFMVLPTMKPQEPTAATTPAPAAATTKTEDKDDSGKPTDEGITTKAQTNPPPMPARGDGADNPKPLPKDDVVCVSKEAVQHKNSVSLKLKALSSCGDTKLKIQSVIEELCGEDCKLEIYQEDNSDNIIVSGKYVEDDVTGMADKFNNDNIKDKTDVEEAVPTWGKNSKLVLVSLLLAGLLLAALLLAGYYLKTNRKNSKGVRLAESFQVDEENQANTLVSVAPLPQEPVDKPTVNGESPPENGTNSAPTTNGHSAAQTPVADTEM